MAKAPVIGFLMTALIKLSLPSAGAAPEPHFHFVGGLSAGMPTAVPDQLAEEFLTGGQF